MQTAVVPPVRCQAPAPRLPLRLTPPHASASVRRSPSRHRAARRSTRPRTTTATACPPQSALSSTETSLPSEDPHPPVPSPILERPSEIAVDGTDSAGQCLTESPCCDEAPSPVPAEPSSHLPDSPPSESFCGLSGSLPVLLELSESSSEAGSSAQTPAYPWGAGWVLWYTRNGRCVEGKPGDSSSPWHSSRSGSSTCAWAVKETQTGQLPPTCVLHPVSACSRCSASDLYNESKWDLSWVEEVEETVAHLLNTKLKFSC